MTDKTNENKHKGFVFLRKPKNADGKNFLSIKFTAGKDIKAGDTVELIAHLANKLTSYDMPYYYMFERDEYVAEGDEAAKGEKKKFTKAKASADDLGVGF